MIIIRRADMTDEDIARFWEKVDKSNECWTWTAATFVNGYGSMCFHGKSVRAHRFAYALALATTAIFMKLKNQQSH